MESMIHVPFLNVMCNVPLGYTQQSTIVSQEVWNDIFIDLPDMLYFTVIKSL